MRKITATILSLLMTVGALSSCELLEEDIGGQLSVGMDNQAFLDIADDQRGFLRDGPYVFFTNAGNNYVALLDYETGKVATLYVFDSVMPMNEDFSKIKKGDDMFTVVELVGLPTGFTSGPKGLFFKSRSGTRFIVYFDAEDKVERVLEMKESEVSSGAGDSVDGTEDSSVKAPTEDVLTYTMTATMDYTHVEGQATVLLNYCNVFFDPTEYGLERIVAGDIFEIQYIGEFIMQDSYPGTVMTEYFTLVDIVVQEAFFIPVTVVQLPEGNLSFVLEGYTASKYVTSKIISQDGTFREASEADIGKKLYASCKGYQQGLSTVQVEAIYDYLPRGEEKGTVACCYCDGAECAYYETYGAYLCEDCYDLWLETQMQPCCYCGLYTCNGCVDE